MSDVPVPVWTCEFKKAPEEGAPELDAVTVGAKFRMACTGDLPVTWGEGSLTFVFKDEAAQFSLAPLKVEALEPNKAELTVTGYKPGQHAPEYARVMQGTNGFEVLKPHWTIQSVLKPNEQAQPFPPFGPWSMPLPWWAIGVAIFVLALIGFFITRAIRRRTQRSRMLADLQRHKTAISAVHQFYKDARGLRRRLHGAKTPDELKLISEDLNREFRLYVLRSFLIPTFDWSDREIMDEIRKRHRKVYADAAEPLKKTLRELFRVRGRPSVSAADVEQLHRMSLDAVERIEGARGSEARR